MSKYSFYKILIEFKNKLNGGLSFKIGSWFESVKKGYL
jgi:hypothetical protein